MTIPRIRPECLTENIFKSFFSFLNLKFNPKKSLEKKLAQEFSVGEVLLTQSARAGLYFLFKALPHQRVFIPVYTCWVVAEAAELAGKEIHFIDIDLADYNMSIEQLKKQLIDDSIILATHQFGFPCDIHTLKKLAQEKNCFLIEDNAAALGSRYHGQLTGSLCSASVISFENSKTLAASRGGAILFQDIDLYKKVKTLFENETLPAKSTTSFRQLLYLWANLVATNALFFNLTLAVFHRLFGKTTGVFNFDQAQLSPIYLEQLDSARCQLALLNFDRLSFVTQRKTEIALFYQNELKTVEGVILPTVAAHTEPVLIRFPIRLTKKDKNAAYQFFYSEGVDLGLTFSYICSPQVALFPNARMAANSVINLPLYSSLTDTQLRQIVSAVKKWSAS